MIRLQDALRLMEEKQPFDLEYVSYNRTTGEGGQLRTLKNIVLTGSKGTFQDNQMRTVKDKHSLQHPHQVHIRLMTKYNDQRIVW